MKDAGWWVSMAVASVVSSGCAKVGTVAPAPTARGANEPASVAVEYEVARKGGDDAVLLRGRTSIDAHDAEVKYAARDREELRLAARERNDGTFDIEVRYREKSQDAEIAWEPVLRVARGASATAEIAGAGWGRTVRVKLE